MPDFSIPNNTIPIRLPPGMRALPDLTTHKVMNPNFWPENIPLPNQDIQFPQITLITKGFRIAPKRAFQPFHYGNMFQTRTIAWLVSINFIALDDLTKEDRDKLDKYHKSLEGQFVWALDDDSESFTVTVEQKNTWLEKYNRRDAFLHRKKVLDLVRRKDVFVWAEARETANRLLDSGRRINNLKNFPHPYHYDRDLQGGRLRRVYPPNPLKMVKSPTQGRSPTTADDKLGKILNFPPGYMPSEVEVCEAGGHMEWRASFLERHHLDSHPSDWFMPPRRFWPIHVGKRKRVLMEFPVPQALPPSKYMLQDAPRPELCWNRPIVLPRGLRFLPMPSLEKSKEQFVEKRAASQGKGAGREKAASKRKAAARGATPKGKMAVQHISTGNGAGAVASISKPSSSALPSQSTASTRDEDVVMADLPASSSQEASKGDADVTMADPDAAGQPSPILRDHNGQTAPVTASNSAPAKKRKREDNDSAEDVPPARRAKWTINLEPSASAKSKKGRSLPLVIPNGTNQIPSARGRALYLPKKSPFPSPRHFIHQRPIKIKQVYHVVEALSLSEKIDPPNRSIWCYRDLGEESLLCKLESLANLRGIEQHRANPNRLGRDWGKLRKSIMDNWVPVPSPLRESVTLVPDEASGEYEFTSSRAFNHKWSVEEFEKKREEKSSEAAAAGMVTVAAKPEEEEDLGVVLPDGMPRNKEVELGWRMKGPRAVFGNILPGGGLYGREASGIWSGPVVPAQRVNYTRAAGWTGQPLVE